MQKVYGLCGYLTQDPAQRYVVAAGNIKTIGQREMLERLTELRKVGKISSGEDVKFPEERRTTV